MMRVVVGVLGLGQLGCGECEGSQFCEAGADLLMLQESLRLGERVKRNDYYWPMKGGNPHRTGKAEYTAPGDLAMWRSPTWSFSETNGSLFIGSPVIDAERNIYLPSMRGSVYKLTSEGGFEWGYNATSPVPGTLALYEDAIFGATNDGHAFALSIGDGKEKWRSRIAHRIGEDAWSVGVEQNLAFFAVQTEDYVGLGNNRIIAVDAKSGQPQWAKDLEVPVHNFQPAIALASMVFSDQSGRVHRVGIEKGESYWSTEMVNPNDDSPGGVVLGPISGDDGGFVYVTRNRGDRTTGALVNYGQVAVHDFHTGKPVWSKDLELEVSGPPALGRLGPVDLFPLAVVVAVGDTPSYPIYNSTDGEPTGPEKRAMLHAFDALSGTQFWSAQVGTRRGAAMGDVTQTPCLPTAWSPPTIGGDGNVYLTSAEGKLFAVADRNLDGKIVFDEGEIQIADVHAAAVAQAAVAPAMLVSTTCHEMHVFRSE